jgi:light-regulated signal transduction histidine kinase (bacteriophytochrome)
MAIDGFSQILLKECQGRVPPEAIEHLQFINRAARRMNELTSGLLRLSRANLAQIRRETVDLSLLAANIVQDLREAEPHREIAVKITAGMNVQADMALMRIVLENLLNNAWKFTSRTDGPEVEVGVAGTEQDPVYFVRDNGAGFDMAGASRLFGTFERLHSASEFPGNGIGLATVQRILGRHGGHIRAESAKGIGTTFFFDVGAPNRHSDPSLAVERSVE